MCPLSFWSKQRDGTASHFKLQDSEIRGFQGCFMTFNVNSVTRSFHFMINITASSTSLCSLYTDMASGERPVGNIMRPSAGRPPCIETDFF